jgi:tripartite-type tricarboxylate transporter receptor subunit TctC
MAPAGTPADIVSKFHKALEAVLATPAMQEKIRALGADIFTMQPDAFTKFLASEAATWIPIVQKIRPKSN